MPLGSLTNWLALSRLTGSFLSKALAAFSLATFCLANLGDLLTSLGIDLGRLQRLLAGSVLFLCGHVMVALRAPEELRGARTIDELVARMLVISNFAQFESRRLLTKAMVTRLSAKPPGDIPDGTLTFASDSATKADTIKAWDQSEAAALYHADLTLRQYDRPWQRWLAFSLISLGLALLLLPTAEAIVQIMCHCV